METTSQTRMETLGVVPGVIFRCSWGYDQTNVDFYEVVKVTPSTATIRKVAQTVERGESGHDRVVPVAGQFIGEPMVKRPAAGWRGEAWITLNSYSGAAIWDGTPSYQTASGWGH